MRWPWRKAAVERPAPIVVPMLGPWLDVIEYVTVNGEGIGQNVGRRGNYVGYSFGPIVVGEQHTN